MMRDELDRSVQVRVWCHGASDACRITDEDIYAMDRIVEAVAFTRERPAAAAQILEPSPVITSQIPPKPNHQ